MLHLSLIMPKILFRLNPEILNLLFRDITDGEAEFYKQSFDQALLRIMLKTSGRFKSSSYYDRLNAVLGIARSAITGKVTRISSFIGTISSHATRMMIAKHLGITWSRSSLSKMTGIVFILIYSLWGTFYNSQARHWVINRSEYIMGHYRKVTDAVTDGTGEQTSRVWFFNAISGYLATETKSMAFLDVASCGEDEDSQMPSWVPNWSREINQQTYNFATRVKKKRVPEIFGFTDGGEALKLVGQSKGKVAIIIRPEDLDPLQSSLVEGSFEISLNLTSEK